MASNSKSDPHQELLGDVQLLFEQGPCFAFFKPGGLLTQAPPNIDSVERRVKAWLKRREDKTGNVYLGVPHRLDRPASGVLVVARHVRAARRLAEQFEGRLVRKTYWTVVEGEMEDDGVATWRDLVRKIPGKALAEVASEDVADAKEAVLRRRVLQCVQGMTWLEVELETGRTHQIRLQTSHRRFPILGDSLYGATHPFGPPSQDPRGRWIALHARKLEFEHPMTREPIAVEAPLPVYWEGLPFSGLPRD